MTTRDTPEVVKRRSDALIGRDQRHHRRPHPLDQAQIVAGEIAIEQRHGGGKGQHPGVAEALELQRSQAGQGERLGQLQLALVGIEGKLVELVDILQQSGRSRQPATVGGGATAIRRGLPVVVLDKRRGRFLAFKGQLLLGQFGHGGGLLQEVAVDLPEDSAHPVIKVGVGKLAGQEFDRGLGIGLLYAGDGALLADDLLVVFGQCHLLGC